MRRRARETFVIGAERVFDDAELDLRNEAEADRDPKSDRDHTAPAEPAIVPQPPAGVPAGVGISREEPNGSNRRSWRPRPSVRDVAVTVAACGLIAVALMSGGDLRQTHEALPTGAGADVESRARARVLDARPPERKLRKGATGGSPESAHTRPDGKAMDGREDRARGAATTPALPSIAAPASAQAPSVQPPVDPAAPPTASPQPSAVEMVEPVQSAASVREEFGP